jgi:hypothetical protein
MIEYISQANTSKSNKYRNATVVHVATQRPIPTDNEIISAIQKSGLYNCGTYTRTVWKDGIDVEELNSEIKDFVKIICG